MTTKVLNSVIGAALLLAAGVPVIARAALGENAQSIEADRVHMKATLRVTDGAIYSVHELQTLGGTLVREYAAASGVVFAVTWQGPFLPDMQQTLGTYFKSYSDAPRRKLGRHAAVSIGQLVPMGVSVEQLQ
jgi:Protein of unknown function (DUF2844)